LGDFGDDEVENFRVASLADENINRLNVAMDDAFTVSGV